MGDAVGSQSLYAVLCYDDCFPCSCSIVRLGGTPVVSEEPWTPKHIENNSDVPQYLAHLMHPLPPECPAISWLFCPLQSSTNGLLFMVPDHESRSPDDLPLHCATFDCTTNSFQSINPPNASKLSGVAVTNGQDIYFLAHPCEYEYAPGAVFERYVPAVDKWDEQVPFPDQGIQELGHNATIVASAVWNDTILLNMGGCQIWAYNVTNRKWYHVLVANDQEDHEIKDYYYMDNKHNNRCYAIIGEGFVVNDTIYALSKLHSDSILALSIKKEDVNDDVRFSCSLRSEIFVPYMAGIKGVNPWRSTRCFVHMGGKKFCLVQSGKSFDCYDDYQTIQVTYMKLAGEDKMVVTNVCTHQLSSQLGQFHIGFCFSHPECKTSALKQRETTLFFNPCNGFVSKQEDKTDFIIDSEVINPVRADEEGHSVFVINFPLDSTTDQLEKELKKFGPIKRNATQIDYIENDTLGNCCCAIVVFESEAAMVHAIKASPISFQDCLVDIVVRRRDSLGKCPSV